MFRICTLIVPSEEDRTSLEQHLKNYPVEILTDFQSAPPTIPTLIVGWQKTKWAFPQQNILDKKVNELYSWTFSKSEKEKEFYEDTEKFFVDSLKKWLPKQSHVLDCIFYRDSELLPYFKDKIDNAKPTYLYFHEGALYLYNNEKNFIVNIKSLSLFDKPKKKITDFIKWLNTPIAFSFENIYDYVHAIQIQYHIKTIEQLRWVKYGAQTPEAYFNIIPNFDVHRYIPFLMSKLNKIEVSGEMESNFLRRTQERDRMVCWLNERKIAFKNDFSIEGMKFAYRQKYKLASVKYSNYHAITGRIYSSDEFYNPQTLNKDNEERADIISRFEGGKLVAFDYTSYEARIALYCSESLEFIQKHEHKDLHYETAKLLFDTYQINYEQRKQAKDFNHSLLYGAGKELLLKNLNGVPDPEIKMKKVKNFLSPIIKKSREMQKKFEEDGYIISVRGSMIRVEKGFASFNNYIQSYAAEIVADKCMEIEKFLVDKKSQFMFQVFDSLVFDFHPEELKYIEEVRTMLSKYNNMEFSVFYRIGDNYKWMISEKKYHEENS